MAQIKIGRLMLGIAQTNCYFVYREGSQEVIFFDPADKGDYIYDKLQEKGFQVKGILLTIAVSVGMFVLSTLVALRYLRKTTLSELLKEERLTQIAEHVAVGIENIYEACLK